MSNEFNIEDGNFMEVMYYTIKYLQTHSSAKDDILNSLLNEITTHKLSCKDFNKYSVKQLQEWLDSLKYFDDIVPVDALNKLGPIESFIEDIIEDKLCVFCKKEYTGYGNSAEPITEGKCCDSCNMNIIINLRLQQIQSHMK